MFVKTMPLIHLNVDQAKLSVNRPSFITLDFFYKKFDNNEWMCVLANLRKKENDSYSKNDSKSLWRIEKISLNDRF
jgi:hypothetical protein